MAFLEYGGVGVRGLAAAVPANVVNNYEYGSHFGALEARAVVEKIGVVERRFAPAGTCASDLSFAAAEKLLTELGVDRAEIDVLVFVSQTPDYRMPASSIILQHRLGLSTRTMCFDLNLACAGFVNGLAMVFALMSQEGVRRALLLNGETRSRVYSAKDRSTALLFGDAGSAALIERGVQYGKSYFSSNSDGSKESLIKAKAGGYRHPSSPSTFEERVIDEHGNVRSEEHGYMNGQDVFNFVLREIPKDIERLMERHGESLREMDFVVFHQANEFMNSYLARKMKLARERVPSCLAKFGNTSSVSIPLTIVSELHGHLEGTKRVLLAGFGAGMSWASAVLSLTECYVADLVEL